MTTTELTIPLQTPFSTALGPELERVAPGVRSHLMMSEPSTHYAGALRKIWRHGGALTWFVGKALKVGDPVNRGAGPQRFELRNQILGEDEHPTMVWNRVTRNGPNTTDATGHLRWDPRLGVLIDSTGPWRLIDVELIPTIDAEGAVIMTSRRQWLRLLGVRFRLPGFLVGSAHTREWEEPEGKIGLSLTLHHPLLGDYAGYEAILEGQQP